MSGAPNNASSPSIVAGKDGTINVVWQQLYSLTSNLEIFYSRSADGGLTWTGQTVDAIISFPDGKSAYNPDIGVDNMNNLYVVWQETDEISTFNAIHFGKSIDGGSSWSSMGEDIIISYPDAANSIWAGPRIAIDKNNHIHVVWAESTNTVTPYQYEIHYSRSDDGGAAWSGRYADQMISYEDGNSAFYPQIVTDDCLNVIVVWGEQESGFNEPHVSYSLDNGLSWSGTSSNAIVSFPDSESGFQPDIALTSNQNLHVVWNEMNTSIPNNYEIHYSKGDPYCATITPTNAVTPTATFTITITPTPTISSIVSATYSTTPSPTFSTTTITPTLSISISPTPTITLTSTLTIPSISVTPDPSFFLFCYSIILIFSILKYYFIRIS